MVWEEYKENIVDPLKDALKNVNGSAADLNLWKARGLPNREERRRFVNDLARNLNSVEMESQKADRHPMSTERNWTELADIENQKIYELINAYGLDGEDSENLPESADELRSLLNSYGQMFEMRLHEQWKNVTGIRPTPDRGWISNSFSPGFKSLCRLLRRTPLNAGERKIGPARRPRPNPPEAPEPRAKALERRAHDRLDCGTGTDTTGTAP